MQMRIARYLRQNVLALTALVVALTGVAYAAAPRNSVVSKSIKDGAVRNQDLGIDSVNSAKTANESLTGADVAAESLAGADVAPKSLSGADIAADSLTGAEISGLTGADITYGAHVVSQGNGVGNQTVTVNCPAGEISTGGGGTTTDPADTGAIILSLPAGSISNPTGWQVTYEMTAAANNVFSAIAVCVPA